MAKKKQRLLRTFKIELFIDEGPDADDLASQMVEETDFLLEKIEALLEAELSGQRKLKQSEGMLHCDYFVSESEGAD